mmetsp:Transcript_36596/g.44690  ORF Transcript_36596/g.44690 Transcript_36596/m.44690 type:complete len:173 (-) Transcript_36596:796-1314(-)
MILGVTHFGLICTAGLLLSNSEVARAVTELEIEEDVEDKLWDEGLTYRPHMVETEDGYILTILHIIPSQESDEMVTKGTVVLSHGSSMDGWSWFSTQHESLPSLLIKAGFDVYLGNDRGTRNSLSHQTMHAKRDAKKYFDYSFAELGKYDAPATLNFARQHSKSERVILIGF